ncbi:MAG: trypsin-like peptidase domain-containing protein, partial [Planctomycetia bacterium]|nr:trypsin-like peptidase domain-containing protein [Planctomycetia bacterium]
MKRLLLIAFIIVMILFASKVFGVEFRRAETFEDAFDASCRVSVSGARGSGTFIGVSGSKAYILTNYHVVTSMKNATLDFWTNGRKESIRGVVDWRYYDANIPCDFARVVVDANELKKIDPPYVALGGADARPGVNSFIISSGAPDGRFTQSWKGHILEYYNDKTAVFTPPPVPGQSGSGICEFVDGELFVTGVLTWLLGEKGSDNSKGGAIPIANLFVALNRRPAPASYDDESPIPPNASECAVENSHAIEFYSQDCPACERVEPMIKKLVDEGVLTRVNTDDDDGFNLAQRYGVNELPTIVVLLNDAKVKTITYKDML